MVRIHPDPPTNRAELGRIACVLSILYDRRTKGAVAQLGERLLCKQEVIGSIPFSSTNRCEEGAIVIVRETGRDSRQA